MKGTGEGQEMVLDEWTWPQRWWNVNMRHILWACLGDFVSERGTTGLPLPNWQNFRNGKVVVYTKAKQLEMVKEMVARSTAPNGRCNGLRSMVYISNAWQADKEETRSMLRYQRTNRKTIVGGTR